MNFKIISKITHVETFARGPAVRIRDYLDQEYAGGQRVRWRHCKGIAEVEYTNGQIWLVEVHWFEANGIGRVDAVDKHRIRRLA